VFKMLDGLKATAKGQTVLLFGFLNLLLAQLPNH